MLVDLATAEPSDPLSCAICVAGAGAAGLSFALQFTEAPPGSVIVLEGGGMWPTAAGQELLVGDNVGRAYFALDVARLRCFGGSTQHWGGWCRPLDPADFEARSWLPDSGWPIGAGDLAPYRARAHDILDLGAVDYSLQALPDPAAVLPFDPRVLGHRIWRFSPPTRFNEKFEASIRRARGVTVCLNANVVDIGLDDSNGRVDSLQAVGPDGRRFTVAARAFVLALGGLETPRLLLNADSQRPNGVGNDHDLVGRYFMEHPHSICGRLALHTTLDDGGAYRRFPRGRPPRPLPAVAPAASARQAAETLNCALMFRLRSLREVAAGYDGLRGAVRGISDLDDDALWRGVAAMAADLDGLAKCVFNKLVGRTQYAPQRVELFAQSEQAPRPDSRVRLTDERDRLGLRRLALDWRLSAIDKLSIRHSVRLLARELGRLGLGRVRLAGWLADPDPDKWDDTLEGGYHHMGTTRMAADPRRGVVDRDCKVHGLDNLYIAGSSVFPTSGFANPTLTIVELALRLADTLSRSTRLRRRRPRE